MYNLRSGFKQLSILSRNNVFKNLFEPGRPISDRRLIRKPLKRFKPTTGMKELQEVNDDEFYESQLSQAQKVAGLSHELVMPRSKQAPSHKFASTTKKIEKDEAVEELEKVDYLPPNFDRSSLPKYEKILGWDKQNPLLKKLKRKFCLTSTPSSPSGDELVVLEGKRMIIEALQAGVKPETFIFSRINLLPDFPLEKLRDCQMVQIPYQNISAWSELKTSPGFMATFRKSDIFSVAGANSDPLPIHLILDNIRTPENLGALLRVAAGAGCKQVIAMAGCANIWNPKSLRSGAGSHLKVSVKTNVTWDTIHRILPNSPQVIVADLLMSSDDCRDGQRSQSLTEKLRDLDVKAGSFKYQDTEQEDGGFRDYSYLEQELLEEYRSVPLPAVPYHQLELCPNQDDAKASLDLVVVVGGETLGVSSAAYKFAHNNLGEKVFVPLMNGIESLNAASAASVIMFEIQKKFIERK